MLSVCVKTIEKTACERLLSAFMFVDATVRTLLPSSISRSMSCGAAARQAQRDGWHETGIYALVHRAGGKVCLVEDGGEHLKLTYPEDLAVLENT